MINLSASGLTNTETKCYQMLLTRQEWLPSILAKNVSETRTNTYKILDKLVALGLAKKFDKNKKLHYRAVNPSRLLQLAHEARAAREKSEQELELHTQTLMREYIKVHESPGVRFFQGKEELKDIYTDQVKTGKPIYIIRPDYNMDIYDFDFMTAIRHMARKAGLQRYAITPDRPLAPINFKESDPFMILERTWIKAGDYTAPVEWNAYGNKLSVMSYGSEAIGMIIDSPQIAEAFRQLYRLLTEGLQRRPDYKDLPIEAKYIGSTAEKSASTSNSRLKTNSQPLKEST